jgi:hypothetical protein
MPRVSAYLILLDPITSTIKYLVAVKVVNVLIILLSQFLNSSFLGADFLFGTCPLTLSVYVPSLRLLLLFLILSLRVTHFDLETGVSGL